MNRHAFSVWATGLIVVGLASSCASDEMTDANTAEAATSVCDEDGDEECVELKEGALAVDDDQSVESLEILPDRLRIRVRDGEKLPPKIKKGGVIFGGKSSGRFGAQDEPFLRKITAVEQDGDTVVVRTEPAALVDAIKRGNFKTSGLKPTVGRVWKQYELPNGKGDAYCKADTDCACPPGLNCQCVDAPSGAKQCLAVCSTDEDCPQRTDGSHVTCLDIGYCEPKPLPKNVPGTKSSALTIGFQDCSRKLVNNEEIADGVTATIDLTDCKFQFEPSIDFEIKVGLTGLKKLKLTVGGELELLLKALAEIDADVNKSGEKQLKSYSFPLKFTLAGIPVKIDFVVTLYGGYLFNLNGYASVEAGYGFTNNVKVGIEYEKGDGWSTIWQAKAESTQYGPTFELDGDMEAEVWLRPELALLLYGIAGPTIDFRTFLVVDADISNASGQSTGDTLQMADLTKVTKEVCWDLHAGFEASIGLYVELLDNELVDEDWTLTEKVYDIASDCYEFDKEIEWADVPTPPLCSFASECMDNEDCPKAPGACVTNSCSSCECVTSDKAKCCSSDSQCDDGNPCTVDSCQLGGTGCSHVRQSNCCLSGAECDSGSCVNNLCVAMKKLEF